MIILIDNYDSFTYNLVQYLGDLKQTCQVFRNDKITCSETLKLSPQAIIISPGPSTPDQAGICLDLIHLAADHNIPLLGICLGHQALGQALGGDIVQTPPMHGKRSRISHTGKGLFAGLPNPLEVARYHSLIIQRDTLPETLEITADLDGMIMAIQHKTKPLYGVQFHPESIATPSGHDLLKNFTDKL